MSDSTAPILAAEKSVVDHLFPALDTLTQALRLRAKAAPNRIHVHIWEDDGRITPLRYGELLEEATAVARALSAYGLGRGHTVALMLPTGREFFSSFFGCLLAGAVPVPLYPPVRADRLEESAERQVAILRNAQARALVTFKPAERLARLLKPRVPSLATVANAAKIVREARRAGASAVSLPVASPHELALIQYTSGSTGEPRGVALTHANILANLRAIAHGVRARADDVVVCWLPLYHDMGLIGCWLFALYLDLPMAVLSPLAFLRRPERWLQAIHRHRGTLSPAPNFAYELCARKIDGRVLDELDLSSWRVALNGAEPVSPDTLERFTRRFARCGFRAQTMMPVYGLAEATVALSFAPLNRPPRVDRVARDSFQQWHRAQPVSANEGEPLRFVSVGRALPEHELRIVDGAGRPVGERIGGEVEFRGPSTMQSYYRNQEATADARTADGWMRTGDLGYWADGELFITGRTKDVVIKAGCNYYPQEIEEAAADAAGVRRGCVAAFSVPDGKTGTEALVVVAETRATDRAAQAKIRSEIKRRIASACRIAPDVVELLRPQTIPKTPSGKLRRSAARQLYLDGRLKARRPPAWWQTTRLVAGSVMARLKRGASPNRPRPLP